MAFLNIKPTTPSRRQLIKINKNHLNNKPILKNKKIGKRKVTGKITLVRQQFSIKEEVLNTLPVELISTD
jgi:ribosomal protein L2